MARRFRYVQTRIEFTQLLRLKTATKDTLPDDIQRYHVDQTDG
jgi:hypothetical protein